MQLIKCNLIRRVNCSYIFEIAIKNNLRFVSMAVCTESFNKKQKVCKRLKWIIWRCCFNYKCFWRCLERLKQTTKIRWQVALWLAETRTGYSPKQLDACLYRGRWGNTRPWASRWRHDTQLREINRSADEFTRYRAVKRFIMVEACRITFSYAFFHILYRH